MNSLFKEIPNINSLILSIKNKYIIDNEIVLKEAVDEVLFKLREQIKNNEISKINDDYLVDDIYNLYVLKTSFKHRKCINATGTVIHTNLGRSLLSDAMLKNTNILTSFNNLEYDIETGKRGSRYDLVQDVIAKVCHAQSALVVNNNAAAVMLILNEFANNKEVIVSNSELVEIGGSFRIPEIIKLAGAKLNNVGTTNKTHLTDYFNAVSDKTGLIAKIHQSNFYIDGFVKSISAKQLVEYRDENKIDIPIYEDLASGALIDLSKYNLDKEPLITESIDNGVDIVSFSGDKLLGSIQAGIIVGKEEYINRLKKNQLLRTIRPSGLILNIIETTFNLYLDPQHAIENIPTLRYLCENKKLINDRALYLNQQLNDIYNTEIIETNSLVGGGCMPKTRLNSYGVAIHTKELDNLKNQLITNEVPIICTISNDKLVLDCKTLSYDDITIIVDVMKSIAKK